MNNKITQNKWTLKQLESFKPYHKYLFLGDTVETIATIAYMISLKNSVLFALPIMLIVSVMIGSMALWLSRKKVNENEITKEVLIHNSIIVMKVFLTQYRHYCAYTYGNGVCWLAFNALFTF